MVWAFVIWFVAVVVTVIPTEFLVDKTRPNKYSQSDKVKLLG